MTPEIFSSLTSEARGAYGMKAPLTMSRIVTGILLILLAASTGCSAMRYEVQVSYSPATDCDITARIYRN
jgi:hypothetical protein